MQCSKVPHLVIFQCELVETFLDDVVSVKIFDESTVNSTNYRPKSRREIEMNEL